MSGKVFLDTNVLIYCYASTEPAKRVAALAVAEHPEACISTQVLQEMAHTLSRKFKKTWDEIDAVIEEVCRNFIVHRNTEQTVQTAIRLAARYGFSFYDSLILAAAIESNCTTLFSEDMQHGQTIDGCLKIANPFAGVWGAV